MESQKRWYCLQKTAELIIKSSTINCTDKKNVCFHLGNKYLLYSNFFYTLDRLFLYAQVQRRWTFYPWNHKRSAKYGIYIEW